MSGHHHHHHDHAKGNIKTAFFLNLVFAIVELIGGWFTNSVAIISDAIHDLGDSLSLGMAWYFQNISGKKKTPDFSFGYKRFSVLGAVVNAVVLTVGSIVVLIEAVPRIFDPVMPDATGMIYLSVLGIAVNGFAAFRLSHGHSMNEKVVYLHLLEDVLGWVATLIVAVILQFRTLPVLDPVLSILISVYILYNVFKNLRSSISILLQGTPAEIDPRQIHQKIREVEGVHDFHDCHIWTMDGTYHVLSGHVVVSESKTMHDLAILKEKIRTSLSDLHIDHITLEFESVEEECQPC